MNELMNRKKSKSPSTNPLLSPLSSLKQIDKTQIVSSTTSLLSSSLDEVLTCCNSISSSSEENNQNNPTNGKEIGTFRYIYKKNYYFFSNDLTKKDLLNFFDSPEKRQQLQCMRQNPLHNLEELKVVRENLKALCEVCKKRNFFFKIICLKIKKLLFL